MERCRLGSLFLGNARGASSWHQLWKTLPTFSTITSILSVIYTTRKTALHEKMQKIKTDITLEQQVQTGHFRKGANLKVFYVVSTYMIFKYFGNLIICYKGAESILFQAMAFNKILHFKYMLLADFIISPFLLTIDAFRLVAQNIKM